MPESPPPLLEVSKLVRKFGTRTAVDEVSFTVRAGESVGLLGPNGAGKSTLLSMICGLLKPGAGSIRVEGAELRGDTDQRKQRIGLVPQELALMETLSARQNLEVCGALQGLSGSRLAGAVDRGLEFVGLKDRARDRVATFSGGMKRRVNLAASILHEPDLLFLDEPTVGVDPQSRNAIFENVAALRAGGMTVVYTTHYMEEVERLCDRVLILDSGRLVADAPIAELRRKVSGKAEIRFELEESSVDLDGLRALPCCREVAFEGGRLTLTVGSIDEGLASILPEMRRRGISYRHVETHRPSLESVFLELTGKTLRDG